MDAFTKATIAFIVAVITATVLTTCLRRPKVEEEAVPKLSAVQLLRKQRDQLTDWQMLILAISFTESRFRPDAVGKAGDSGHLQLLPIYVDEVNRVAGTDYSINDAFDIDKSLEMFNLLQEHYNPSKDIDEAIRYHNKSPQYRKAVLENLEMIRRYETIRAKLIGNEINLRHER